MSEENNEDKPPEPPSEEEGVLMTPTKDLHCVKTLQETSASVFRMVSE